MKKSSPFYRPISIEHIKQIDQKGRLILRDIGVHFIEANFLDRMEGAGARVNYDNQRVYFSEECLDRLLSRAPSKF
ncbi:MAG: trimethylamine methyltransferase family protein, partial [Chloroflexota bacterium]|nr:trimethylamine methyltransferase family protein [Chloroflexota bacterium]